MRVISCKAENFASYKELEFHFDDKGLTLVHGATGSGKSTLCDLIPWVLFGGSAKGGTVDEIRSWNSKGTTYGHLVIDMGGYSLWIARTRAPNDLYYIIDGVWENPKRGKDLADTQKLINELLGMDYELYLSGAYLHEFSQTSQFFTTSAKNRRVITEQLVDLSLPKKLTEEISAKTKEVKEQLILVETRRNSAKVKQTYISKKLFESDLQAKTWEKNQENKLKLLEQKFQSFQYDKEKQVLKLSLQINSLDVKSDSYYAERIASLSAEIPKDSQFCEECGAPKLNERKIEIEQQILDLRIERGSNAAELKNLTRLREELTQVKAASNSYEDSIKESAKETNPFLKTINDLSTDLKITQEEINKSEIELTSLLTSKSDLEILKDIVDDFRGILIKNTVLDVEDETNLLLNKHFDSEIQIELSIEAADKLEVKIMKDGNAASFTQLSKGQRQMLKLSFGIAVMKIVSNHHGLKFSQIFLDECLDGLDETNKLKAVGLLESLALEYASIYFVEHSESVKAMVNSRYKVELINGESQICRD